MLFGEEDFVKRLKSSVSEAWKIFRFKAGNGMMNINKEASMQLQYACILQNLMPLILYGNDEKIEIELEKTVKLDNGSTCEVDVFVTGRKNNIQHTIAVEMKCYKEYAASGRMRGTTNIFMKDVYVDLEKLERYVSNNICQDKVFLAMTDLESLGSPQKTKKDAKCWDYDISNDYKLMPKHIITPIGGKEQSITISGEYNFNWIKNGGYYFLEL